MGLRWKSGKDDASVAQEVLKVLSLSKDGKVQIESFFTDLALMSEVECAIRFPDAMPKVQRARCVREGVLTWVRDTKRRPATLLRSISNEAGAYAQKPLQHFRLVTTLSVAYDKRLRQRLWGTTMIRLYPGCPPRYARARALIQSEARVHGTMPTTYATAVVTGKGRCEFEAVDNALDSIDELRGLWNLLSTYGSERTSFGAAEPANRVVIGPLHSLHRVSGAIVNERQWWWEPAHIAPLRPKPLCDDFGQLRKNERWVRRRMWGSPVEEALRTSLRRLARAMDHWDQETAFTKLWAILEYLTDTGRQNYDVTIRRGTALMRDRDQHRRVLDYIRDRRNEIVHRGSTSESAEMLVFRLKRYVERLWIMLMNQSRRVASLAEFGELLHLPCDRRELDSRQRLLKLAIRLGK